MSSPLAEVQNLYERYVKWVSGNPSALADVELTVKWLSYFVAGKINNSSAVSELVYSLSNLLVFFNDRIIEKASKKTPDDTQPLERHLNVLLTTLEYCEVFIELSAHKVWGTSGRWFFIVVIQTIKCIGRLILTLFCQNTKIIRNPPIPALNRKTIQTDNHHHDHPQSDNASFRDNLADGSSAIVLKRSGRVMRKVNCSPSLTSRSWKPPATGSSSHQPAVYGGKFLVSAEMLYIAKPLIHLASMRKFGTRSWTSYLIALALDSASLRMYYKNREVLSKDQRVELSRRCVSMLLYLMRSPFYDRYTHDKIACLLNGIGNNVPLTGSIARLILSYIPHWQETYFYMWST
ncbi:AGAP002283-PA [Anopheles gambiae str. PEST]|uniref:Peroxisomal membrane protein PEX16 n=3 Tax=gambiae species complex TaxID=44542 RepID=Q7QKE2_ANOGA|nr:peroxisomal membrane protein PEX16 [Anopheles coluzzii]XP_307896.3 peroxisomal membrane protein PEX16 [Anopheles gambiae]EAA03714.3 AGAP002283-PA [Anopheles gambiae str. PEST]